MKPTPRPKTRTIRVNFFVSPDELADLHDLQGKYGAEFAPLTRLALRIMDEQNEAIEKVEAQQVRSAYTAILLSPADATHLERIVKRNKCTKADVIRYAIHALHTRGLRFG
jgi:hypothetical protein